MVIDAGLGMEDYCSISRNCDERGLKQFDARIDLQTKLEGPVGRILVETACKVKN
jgi:hypothetical protein